jgi:hypothetical protein
MSVGKGVLVEAQVGIFVGTSVGDGVVVGTGVGASVGKIVGEGVGASVGTGVGGGVVGGGVTGYSCVAPWSSESWLADACCRSVRTRSITLRSHGAI